MPEGSDLLPLSALQYWAYCPRQCALIHVEHAFDVSWAQANALIANLGAVRAASARHLTRL